MKGLGLLLALALGAACPAGAQARPAAWSLQGGVDALGARATRAAFGALGVSRPLGTYARATAVGALGVNAFREPVALLGRADVYARLTTDPFAERRRAPYVAAGLTARLQEGGVGRTDLLLLVGVDGPVRAGRAWALEGGVGGGWRVGLVRRAVRAGRR